MVMVRSEGFNMNEKFQWHQLGSKQLPSELWHSTLTTVLPRSPKLTGIRKRRGKQLLDDRKEKRILEIVKKH